MISGSIGTQRFGSQKMTHNRDVDRIIANLQKAGMIQGCMAIIVGADKPGAERNFAPPAAPERI